MDWVESTTLDLFFLRHFLFPTPGKGYKGGLDTVAKRTRYAARRVTDEMGPLADRLGFGVFVRKKGPQGAEVSIRNLIVENSIADDSE